MTRGQEPDDQALSLRDDGIALFQVADELYTARRFNLPTVPATATEPVGGRPPVR